ncbi:helix-turn-helix domain-containing protein [Marinilactibacillus kalidii]|uniref:helix-turn-helix domain-containing protein n=1 Tax=Marinilactibacillus kalidii TaxID=2820274 RepID=UPI001ABEB6F6|nr:helix-turn-helix domain-containing protein [Marinilactibacillus kalidii]
MKQYRYFLMFILKLFNKDYPSKSSQLIHVFNGRRTPSILYKVENEQLHPAFGLFKELTKEQLQKLINQLVREQLLEGTEQDGYIKTEKGINQVAQYFNQHAFPDSITSLENATLRTPFYYQFQLLGQIFSEKRYENNKYSPTIKDPVHQESIKMWLSNQPEKMDQLAQQWSNELYRLLNALSEEEAYIVVGKLTGHPFVGRTNRQLAEELDMEPFELIIRTEQVMETIIKKSRSEKGTLLNDFVDYLDKRTYFGLSKSTLDTYYMIGEGKGLEEVSEIRKLKISTIREHILEIYLIHPDFDFTPFIPKEIYMKLKQSFLQQPSYMFKQAKVEQPDMLFMWFRLIEIERIRNGR